MKALVIGIGISGKAAIKHLLERGWEVVAHDRVFKEEIPCPVFTEQEGIDVGAFDLVVVSPGVALTHPLIVRAYAADVNVIGEAELAFREMKNRVIAITGTNGKSTLVSLITHVLNSAGQKAVCLGNIGTALSSAELDSDTIVVAEMSSFQLETLSSKIFSVAALINVTPDHLDRHHTMEEYCKAKLKIASSLLPGGKFFVGKKAALEFGYLMPSDLHMIEEGGDFALPICKEFGVTEEAYKNALKTFTSLRHRLQYLGKVRGIACYNDSKGTNVDATMYAVQKMGKNIILLAGGKNKGASFAPWREHFRGKVTKVIVFGEAKWEIFAALQGAFELPLERNLGSLGPSEPSYLLNSGKALAALDSQENPSPVQERVLQVHVVNTLQEAFEKGLQLGAEGDNLILSPGCASFDQFANYEERGNIFIRMVEDESKRHNTCCSLH